VHETPGYCWSTSFNVLGVLFLGEVSSAFLPSKTASWTPKFRHLGVDQQYPPVISTGWRPLPPVQRTCRTTHFKNLCQLGSSSTCFSTPRTLLASREEIIRLIKSQAGGQRRGVAQRLGASAARGCRLPARIHTCEPNHSGICGSKGLRLWVIAYTPGKIHPSSAGHRARGCRGSSASRPAASVPPITRGEVGPGLPPAGSSVIPTLW
jgi:hypothetical protein